MNDQSTTSTAPVPSSTTPLSPEAIVAEAIERHIAELGAELSKSPLPSESQLERMEALSRLRSSLVIEEKMAGHSRRIFGICFVSVLIVLLLWAGYSRVTTTTAEFDVKASSIEMDFEGGGKNLLIPGEPGEVLSLTHVTVTGIEKGNLPPNVEVSDSLQLQQDGGKDAPPVRLQQFSPPASGPFTLRVETSYQSKERGMVLSIAAAQTSSANLSGPILQSTGQSSSDHAPYEEESVTGKNLNLEVYPVSSPRAVTVVRNARIKAIRFQTNEPDHGTSVLGGSVFEHDIGEHPIEIHAGDILQVAGTSMRVRQLTFHEGTFQLALSSPKSSMILLGADAPRNLMPTFLQRWISLWPTQLYATLSAIVLFWLGIEKWWKDEK